MALLRSHTLQVVAEAEARRHLRAWQVCAHLGSQLPPCAPGGTREAMLPGYNLLSRPPGTHAGCGAVSMAREAVCSVQREGRSPGTRQTCALPLRWALTREGTEKPEDGRAAQLRGARALYGRGGSRSGLWHLKASCGLRCGPQPPTRLPSVSRRRGG